MTTNLSKQDRLPQIRVFVAVELPADLREYLGTLQSSVKASADVAKWVAPELLHITLRFLGEIPEQRMSAVELATRAAAGTVKPFELRLAETGAFPHARNPRVLWVGLEPDAGVLALQRLQEAAEYQLDQHAFGREQKQFSPHITIGRLRDRSTSRERRDLGEAWLLVSDWLHRFPRSFPVDTVTVMRSDLGSGGPRYIPLARIPLDQNTEP